MEQSIVLKLEPELLQKIDKYRKGLSREDYVRFAVVTMLADDMNDNPTGQNPETANLEPNPYVTREDFEKFKEEIEKLHFEFTSLLNRFCIEQVGEISNTERTYFYKEFVRLLELGEHRVESIG